MKQKLLKSIDKSNLEGIEILNDKEKFKKNLLSFILDSLPKPMGIEER